MSPEFIYSSKKEKITSELMVGLKYVFETALKYLSVLFERIKLQLYK